MIKRNLLLGILVILITLPIFFSFVLSIASPEVLADKTYATSPIDKPEEESKEDESSMEKEKTLPSITYHLSIVVSVLESNAYLFNHSKPINGSLDLPFNPPELI